MAVPSFPEGSSASTSPLASILGLEWAKIQTGHRCHPVSAAILLRRSPSAAHSFTRDWARQCKPLPIEANIRPIGCR